MFEGMDLLQNVTDTAKPSKLAVESLVKDIVIGESPVVASTSDGNVKPHNSVPILDPVTKKIKFNVYLSLIRQKQEKKQCVPILDSIKEGKNNVYLSLIL